MVPKRPHPRNFASQRARVLAAEPLEQRCLLTAGTLDLTLGGTGVVSSHPGQDVGQDSANSIAVTSSGKIVQVGQAVDPITLKTDIAVVRYNQDGTLDGTFGSGGVVLTPITTGSANPVANQVLIDSQGRIVVIGGDGTNFELVRYSTSGALDGTFGSGGLVSTPLPGGGSGQATRAAFDTSGDLLVGGSGVGGQFGVFAPLLRYGPNGVLDTSFGLNGAALADFPTAGLTTMNSLIVEPDGSIVVGGNNALANSPSGWALLRFTRDGLPDPSFGTSGAVITSFGKDEETAYGLAEQPDGKILAVGSSGVFAAGGFDIARYNPNGTLDATFGTGGKLTTNISGEHANALDVIVDANGKIIVGGMISDVSSEIQFAVARYLADGTVDSTFGGAGLATTLGAPASEGTGYNASMALDPATGNIVMGSTTSDFTLARFTGDPLVPSTPLVSSSDALVQASSSAAVPLFFPVTLSSASNQQVVVHYTTSDGTAVAGTDYAAASGQLTFLPGQTSKPLTVMVNPNTKPEPDKSFVLNLSGGLTLNDQYSGTILSNIPVPPAAGSLDFTFGWAGYMESKPAPTINTSHNVAVQPDNKVVQVGTTFDSSLKPLFGIVRYNVDGTLDSTFGAGGVVTTPLNSTSSAASCNAVVVQANGDIVVVGGDGTNMVVARYLSNGTLDTTFGTQGIVTLAVPAAEGGPANANWIGQRAAIDAQGNIVIGAGGFSLSLGFFGAVIKLNGTDGTLSSGFGTGGVAVLKFGSTAITNVDALLIQANGQIVLGGGVGALDQHWLVGRINASGTIDATFGSGGVVSTVFDGGKNDETVYGLAQQADGKIVAVGAANILSNGGFDLARYTTTGALDFVAGNPVQVSVALPGVTVAFALDVAVLPSGNILVAGTADNSSKVAGAVLAEFTPSLSLDPNFGTTGVAIPFFGGVSQTDVQMVLSPQGQAVLASTGKVVPGGSQLDFNVERFNVGAAPTISVGSATQIGAGTMSFPVVLSQTSAKSVTVQYQTVDGTALAGQDYTVKTGTLTFAAGTTTATINVTIKADAASNANKLFFVDLSNAMNGAIAMQQATGTIQGGGVEVPTWTNPANRLDVDGDGHVSPADAIAIINYLNSNSPTALGAAPSNAHEFFDVDGDGNCTANDAITVINALNAVTNGAVVANSSVASVASVGATVSSTEAPATLPGLTADEVAFAVTSGAGSSAATAKSAIVAPVGTASSNPSGPAISAAPNNAAVTPAKSTDADEISFSDQSDAELGSNADVEDLLDLLVQR